eukprot:438828_1
MGLDERTKQKISIAIAVIGAFFTMGMSIASFITANKSYSYLNEIKGDYEVHIIHWDSLPLLDVQIIGPDDACNWGYELAEISNSRNALQTIGEFPGSKAWCDCRDGGFDYTYTYTKFWCECGSGKTYNGTTYYSTSPGAGSCSDKAIKARCETDYKLANATETWYTQQDYCHTNASLAGCANDDPIAPVDLSIWKHHKLCYKRGGWSALQRIALLNIHSASCESGVVCQQASPTQDPQNTICAKTLDECPIVQLGDLSLTLDTNESDPILNNSYSVAAAGDDIYDNYLPIVEIRQTIGTPCWKGSFGQSSRSNNERVKNKYNNECEEEDTRFIYWDSHDEPSLYNENKVPTGGNNLMGNGDYSEIQYYNTSTDVNWVLTYRRQIFWSSNCDSGDITDLRWHLKPLRRVVDYQLALLVVNGIFGLGLLGICLPVIMLLHACDKDHDLPCVPGEGEQERNNLNKIQKVISLISKIAKMIPLILCLVVTDTIHWFFTKSGESECSDPLTNRAMSSLGEQIDEVKNSNYNTLYLDIALICWYLVPFSIWIFKTFIKKETDENKETPIDGTEGKPLSTQPIPLNVAPVNAPLVQPVYVQQAPQPVYVQPAPQAVYVQRAPQPIQVQPGYNQGMMYVQQPVYVQPPGQQPQPGAQPLQPDAAATKLQAAWKGHRVRKSMKENPDDPMAKFYYN